MSTMVPHGNNNNKIIIIVSFNFLACGFVLVGLKIIIIIIIITIMSEFV